MINFLKICLHLVTFIMGFFVGKLFILSEEVVIDKNINPVHALSIFVTLFIAILITVFFQTKKEINNTENEIIIKRIDKIIEIIDCLHDSVCSGKVAISQAPALVKRIHNSSKYIWDSCFSDQAINVSIKFELIEAETRKINDLLTNTPANHTNVEKPPVQVVDNNYEYNDLRIVEIEKHIEDLKNKLFKIQLEVNRKLNR
ncbi:MAG: hypothetical protein H6936_11370 [Burkholderiales bacterium]|nr:hypothetical protein [Burkholderiales bacterium]